jgi:hypothetical protein
MWFGVSRENFIQVQKSKDGIYEEEDLSEFQ